MTSYDTHKYIDVLGKIVNNINNSKSYSTGYIPSKVDDKIEEEIYKDKTIKKIQILNEINDNFQIGDIVKILKKKELFSKGQHESYSKENYEITGKDHNKFILLCLENGKIVTALPYQLKKINNSNVISNPFLKNKTILDKDKKIFYDNKAFKKQERKLKHEGIYDEFKK